MPRRERSAPLIFGGVDGAIAELALEADRTFAAVRHIPGERGPAIAGLDVAGNHIPDWKPLTLNILTCLFAILAWRALTDSA